MAGPPGFQEIQGLGTVDFADRNAIGAQPQRRTYQIGQRSDAVLGAQRHQVWRLALKLARILDQNNAVGRPRHFGEERVDERRLAGRCTAGNQNVSALRNGITEDLCLLACHYANGGIVSEGEDSDRRLADRERRCRDDRRDQSFEALSGLRQLGRNLRRCRMHLGADMVGNETHDAFAVSRRQSLSGVRKALG
jgi:hypothetical protein